jgi:hypothetical protein
VIKACDDRGAGLSGRSGDSGFDVTVGGRSPAGRAGGIDPACGFMV